MDDAPHVTTVNVKKVIMDSNVNLVGQNSTDFFVKRIPFNGFRANFRDNPKNVFSFWHTSFTKT